MVAPSGVVDVQRAMVPAHRHFLFVHQVESHADMVVACVVPCTNAKGMLGILVVLFLAKAVICMENYILLLFIAC